MIPDMGPIFWLVLFILCWPLVIPALIELERWWVRMKER